MKKLKRFFATSVSAVALVVLLCFLLAGCNEWKVKKHSGFMTPDVYELTNGDVSIKYYNGDCCCIAKDVLTEVKLRIENNQIDVAKLKDKKFVDDYLRNLCNEMRANK